MQSTLTSGRASLAATAARTPGRGLGRGPDPQSAARRRPSGRARPCPPAACRRCARRRGRARGRAGRPRSRRGASPTSWTRCAATLPGTSSCTSAAPSRACATPTTAGSVSYVTRIRSATSSATYRSRRDDHDDRLADVVHLVAGQRVAGAAVGERGVRDEQRQRLGDPGAVLGVGGREVLVGVDRDEARRRRARRRRRCRRSGRARAGCGRTPRRARPGRGRRGSGRRR